MFEIGENYEFHMLEAGDDVTFWGIIERYEHPLIKLQDIEPMAIKLVAAGVDDDEGIEIGNAPALPGKIINVTSPAFVSAVKKER